MKKSSPYKIFMEGCQRRHIFAHNGGIVNDQYTSNCVDEGIPLAEIPALGTKISITPEYLNMVAGNSYLLGLFIIQMAIQKLGDNEKKVSMVDLLSISHDFLLIGQIAVCRQVLDFAEYQKDISTDLKLMFGINRSLCCLLDKTKSTAEQNSGVREILMKYDWSVTTPVFDLALACVRREFQDILSLARKAYSSGLDYLSASIFIVFAEARKIDGFMNCFPKKLVMIEHNIA